MKNKYIIFLCLSSVSIPLLGLIGSCCKYGQDPQSPSSYNYQQRYFVECYCKCTNTLGKCVECGHFHEPQNKQVVVRTIHRPTNK